MTKRIQYKPNIYVVPCYNGYHLETKEGELMTPEQAGIKFFDENNVPTLELVSYNEFLARMYSDLARQDKSMASFSYSIQHLAVKTRCAYENKTTMNR